MKIAVRGAVQGVGFRPFVYRLAIELGLAGWVNNSPQGVAIEIEGRRAALDQFLARLKAEKPARSYLEGLEAALLDPVGHRDFAIRPSEQRGEKTALVLPDLAACPECVGEIFDPQNRRFQYPFTNCTHCGPRFSIIEALPYDRANTTMRRFVMCADCQAEYENPRDRRYHAQPNACAVCGPHVELWDRAGRVLGTRQEAMLAAVKALREGLIVAVKGLGGFHLMVTAGNDTAVRRLRQLKQREEKPFALMFPTLAMVKEVCHVSAQETDLLTAPEVPIVLLKQRAVAEAPAEGPPAAWSVAPAVAPGNPCLGIMLPYTPLHHLLLAALGLPVVATSGNASDEPICTDEQEALDRLGPLADLLLVHDRPILRHVDDSIMRLVAGRPLVLRRARGLAPWPVPLPVPIPPTLAVGAHLKNTVALAQDRQVFLSQHIGDLETEPAWAAFRRVAADLPRLYETQPAQVACDMHPDYLSTRFAQASGAPVCAVQHHYAHVLACMAENELAPPVLGVAWDGTGLGSDGTIWGGEFLLVTEQGFERLAHLRPFRLPGGDKAVQEPRRAALGLLYEMFGEAVLTLPDLIPVGAFREDELAGLARMLSRNLNTPWTSSMGRLFDAVASLVGLRQVCRFEGQAATELEYCLAEVSTDDRYELPIVSLGLPRPGTAGARLPTGGQVLPAPVGVPADTSIPPLVLDWSPMIQGVLNDLRARLPGALISAKFHNGLVEAMVAVARQAGEPRVALSGGCFQNRYLTERAIQQLAAEGFHPYWHQRVPPNDGGIALGQVVAAGRTIKKMAGQPREVVVCA